MNTRKPFEYSTGRIYDKAQVLKIVPGDFTPSEGDDEWAFVTYHVTDEVRRMKFRVTCLTFFFDTDREIGKTILSMYDLGQYVLE